MASRRPPAVLAIDVGGTDIKGAVIGQDGVAAECLARGTGAGRGPDAVLTEVRRLAADLAASAAGRCELMAAGVVVPGFVDPDTGIAHAATNIGWKNVPLRRLLSEDLNLPVAVDHDVRSAGLAEARLGYGRDATDFGFVAIGTGIATAIVVDGMVRRGSRGRGGELGHIPVHPNGARCDCGRQGCLEAYASAAAIARRYAMAAGSARTAAEISGRLSTDPVAARVWNDAMTALALALATYISLLDPQLVVLGGGLTQAGPRLLEPLTAELSGLLGTPGPPVRISRLGVGAGRLGAAILAWQRAGHAEVVDGWALPRVPAAATRAGT
jgi:glucokinase